MADYSEKDQIWSGSPIEPSLFYQAIFQSEFAVYVLHVDGEGIATFEDANDTVAGIAGLPVSEIRGKTPMECLPPEIAQCLESHARECVRTGETLNYERSLDLPTGKVAFRTRLMPVARRFGTINHLIGLTRDITSEADLLEGAQDEVRDLSKRMLTLQLDERRKIAEELHDSTGQHLTAIGLALARARSCPSDPASLIEAIDDAKLSLREVQRETRVLSYLLHPPEIESQGLSRAIANFAAGFAKRAGFQLELHISPEANSLGDDLSLNLFRVCQEALTNVYRHSEARKASIVLGSNGASVTLAVTDDGVGFDASSMPQAPPLGVGLAGMRERMRRLGGEISISGGPNGTTLIATAPTASRGP